MAQTDIRLTDVTQLQPQGGIIVGAQGVQGVGGLGARQRTWRAAVTAAAFVISSPCD